MTKENNEILIQIAFKIKDNNNLNRKAECKKYKFRKISNDLIFLQISSIYLKTNFVKLEKQENEPRNFNEKLHILSKQEEEADTSQKYLLKTQPMTVEIYCLLIQEAINDTYIFLRLRLILFLLLITGMQLKKLLKLKTFQLQQLLELFENETKDYLTEKGKKIVEDRKKDMEFVFRIKDSNSYIFTSKSKPDKMLCRETMTREISKVIRLVSKNSSDQRKLNIRSFRLVSISELWKDIKNVKFIKQVIETTDK